MWPRCGALLLRRNTTASLIRAIRFRIQIVTEQRKQPAYTFAVARPMAADLIAFDGLARRFLWLRRSVSIFDRWLRALRCGRRERFGWLHCQRLIAIRAVRNAQIGRRFVRILVACNTASGAGFAQTVRYQIRFTVFGNVIAHTNTDAQSVCIWKGKKGR